MKGLTGKVVIVTGAAHPEGMGYAICKRFVESGAKVVVTDLAHDNDGRAQLKARAKEIVDAGGAAIAIAVDITDRQQIAACMSQVMATYGRIDVLVNNAGTPIGVGDFLAMTDQQWDVSYQVNLKGLVNFSQAVLPYFIEQGGGNIVNNASLAGLGTIPGMAAYSATKFAVVGLTKALAAEFGGSGVRVNAVCPGMVWTQMGRIEAQHEQQPGETLEETRQRLVSSDLVPLARWAEPGEVADAVVYLASTSASYITGVTLPVAGGMAPGL